MKYVLAAIAALMFSTGAWAQACGTSGNTRDNQMPTPIEIVTAFSAGFPQDMGKASIRRWFTPRTVWINGGVFTATGIDEAIAFIERPGRSPDIAAVHFDMLAIAADGNRVLTERLDRFVRTDGSEVSAVKVMGIFEIEGGCIVAWRDYFDVNFGKKTAKDP
jgi:limonene-1,2-epoxide hydrolase